MTECTNHRPWDTETPSHKISHDEYYEKRGTIDKTKPKPSMLQPCIQHTRITTVPCQQKPATEKMISTLFLIISV